MAHISRLVAAAPFLLLLPPSLFAHHKGFYQQAFFAIEKADVEGIKDLFSKSAWDGNDGAMSAAELQKRLKNGKRITLFRAHAPPWLYELSSTDKARSKCLVTFKLEYPDKKVEQIWLLAEDVDPRDRSWDWRIVRIVNDEKQAQSFFKHSLPKDE